MVCSHVPLCRSVRETKEGFAVLAIAAIKTSIPVIRRSNDINGVLENTALVDKLGRSTEKKIARPCKRATNTAWVEAGSKEKI